MWIPKDQAELEDAVSSGAVEESSIFDAKREMPSNNREIAKDIAAMANDGGVIIYGIGEDENGRPTKLNPIPLNGQSERIDAIVQTAIAEPPIIHISKIPTLADQSIGYLIVHVPVSERAPHMVVVKGDHRYYGRSAKGNKLLSEAEVARLYERRERWEVDRDRLLSKEIESAPFQPNNNFAYLHLIARSVTAKENILERAAKEDRPVQSVLFDLVEAVTKSGLYPVNYYPNFHQPREWLYRAEGFLGIMFDPSDQNDPGAPRNALYLQVDRNGTGHLFCGRAAERRDENLLFFSEIVAGNTIHFIALLGQLYDQSHYLGMVDIGLAVTGLKGSILYTKDIDMIYRRRPYDREDYRRTERASAIMFKDEPIKLAERLLTPLFNVFSQGRINLFSQARI